MIIRCISILLLFSTDTFAANVNPDGSFGHSIDITLPPGTNGMAPKLALVYNSNSENGMLGVGWSLSGLPCITRDPGHVINYDGSDNFTGPGGKLVYISTGDQAGYYHYENESFCRVQANGSQGDGSPAYWIETKPDGTKYYYGDTDDSKVLAAGKGQSVRVWALSRVEDLYGNYYTITYYQDNGAYYPDTITYTDNTNPLYTISGKRTVVFGYDESSRTDWYSGYPHGSRVLIKWLLNQIDISVDGETRTYTLNYDPGDTAVKSRLISVRDSWDESGPTEMEYNYAAAEANAWEETNYPIIGPFSSKGLADINGDGLIDYTYAYSSGFGKGTYLNTGSSFIYTSNPSYLLPAYFEYYWYFDYSTWGYSPNHILLLDINGDGLTDCSSNRTVFLFNGSTWTENTDFFLPEPINSLWRTRIDLPHGSLTDINNDGLTDFIVAYSYNNSTTKHTYINTGSGFPTTSENPNYRLPVTFVDFYYELVSGYYEAGYELNNIKLIDINGDGYTDCVDLRYRTVYFVTLQ